MDVDNPHDYPRPRSESEQRNDEWMWRLHREEVFGRRIALFTSAGSHRMNRVIVREIADRDICGEFDEGKGDRSVMAGHDRRGPAKEIAAGSVGTIRQYF
jgi:hypothetical protein